MSTAMDPEQVDPVGLSGEDQDDSDNHDLDDPGDATTDRDAGPAGAGAEAAAEADVQDEGSGSGSDLTDRPTDTESGSRDPDPTSDDTPDDDAPAADVGDGEEPSVGSVPPPDASDEEIEADREERLDPDNRPDGAEVDNTQRDFDPEKGMFTDSEGYDEADAPFPPMGDQGA